MSAADHTQPKPPVRRNDLLPSAIVGVVAGLDNIGSSLAIASLLFAGPLVAGLGVAVSVMFLGGAVLAFVVALRSSQPNSVALVQESTIAILAVALATMATSLDISPEAKIATALAILGVSSLATGALFWIIGRLGLGRVVRFLPYPVVAGFLAGTGWLLVNGAATMLTGAGIGPTMIESLSETHTLYLLAPAIVFAITMLVALKRFPHAATIPAVMLAAVAIFYGVLAVAEIDIATAQAQGYLPSMETAPGLNLPNLETFALIHWPAVLTALPSILSLAILSMIALLLNISGLELASGGDIDVNHELRSSGTANLLSGTFGGPPGYVGISIMLLAHKVGARSRGAGLATAAVMLVGLLTAGPLISHVPVFLTAGFILFLGLELLGAWLLSSRRQLPTAEWLIVVVILAVVALVGFIEALAVGLAVSVALFAFNYSRLPVVRLSASGTDQRSAVDRSPAAMQHLLHCGGAIEVVQLQGYLFFGTAERMVDHVRQRLADKNRDPLRFLVLDFRHVSGVDSAAATSFVKVRSIIEANDVRVFFTQVPPDVERSLRQAGITFGEDTPMVLEGDIDHAVERAEEALLHEQPELHADADLLNHFEAAIGPHPRLHDLVDAMTRLALEPGHLLIKAGDDADDVYFVAHGRVRVESTLPSGRTLRLRTMTAGAIVGEIALYLHRQRTADVIVETPSDIFHLSAVELERLEREDPVLALLTHKLLASNLSEKLSTANRMIQARD